jgi:16S rRNA C1402 N4-methylase RsmH
MQFEYPEFPSPSGSHEFPEPGFFYDRSNSSDDGILGRTGRRPLSNRHTDRGFHASRGDGPLDMRMDTTAAQTAVRPW